MNETEIIEYLKGNKTKGVIFLFMPREVREWCESNLLKTDIPFRKLIKIPSFSLGEPGNDPHSWDKLNYDESFCYKCVYCLDDDYELKPQFVPHWEEFDIDEEGNFSVLERDGRTLHSINHWSEWSAFLANNNERFNAFGGWLYVDSDKKPTWYTSPRVDFEGRAFGYVQTGHEFLSKPAIPTKIRFWRCKE